MIQRFTCVPSYEYDILILTNGLELQVEDKLKEINHQLDDCLPKHMRLTYLDSFAELVVYLDNFKADKSSDVEFNGKIFFMFFDGVEFIQQVLIDSIDYYQKCLMKKSQLHLESMYQLDHLNFNTRLQPPYNKLNNCYFYFDSSIFNVEDVDLENGFNHLITIVSDVLKKTNYMLGSIRGIVIDDCNLLGEKIFPIHCLLRNYPRIERIELSSDSQVQMKGLLT